MTTAPAMRFLRWLAMLCGVLALAGCGGSSTPTTTTPVTPVATPTPTPSPTPAVANVATVVLDGGPAALQVGTNGYSAFNEPYVTITICAPGTSTCQTIDHVILDTGSVGLRIVQSVISASLLAALPVESGPQGNPVGECYQYVNSYAFGSVRIADFQIAGEKVANMPFHAIGDTGRFASIPAACSAGGGTSITSAQAFGGNAILGIGTTVADCGALCASGSHTGATYYDCPATGCGAVIARAANAAAPFEQLPNPVAAFATDNNGSVLTLPAVPQAGLPTLIGTVTFGIATQANNGLTATTILPLTASGSNLGPGLLTATYKGKALTQSFFDSGSNDYFFIDTSLTVCSQPELKAFYCPNIPLTIAPIVTATDGTTFNAQFTLYNPNGISGSATVAPGLGINPTLVVPPLPFANSFDFGMPFFFGRSVYTAIEGRAAGNRQGPYVAF